MFPCEGGQRWGRPGAVGAFCPNPATYLPSPLPREKDLCVYCQEDGAKQFLESPFQLASSLGALPTLSARWGGKVQGAKVPTEPGSWPCFAQAVVTRSGPLPAPRIKSSPPSGQVCWHLPSAPRMVVLGTRVLCTGEEVAPHTCSNCERSFPGAEAGEGWGEGRSRQRGCVPAPGACGNQRC